MWHVSVCSKYSVSPLSSKNDLKITLRIAFCFENIIKKEHSETLFISCYIIAKKLSSSFRKTWLNKKIYCKIALTSRQQTIISWCVLTQIFFYIILSVIRQKGESQNGCFKKTKHVKFSEKRIFLTTWYAHNLFCWNTLALFPYYRRFDVWLPSIHSAWHYRINFLFKFLTEEKGW